MKVTVTFGDTAVVVPCKAGWTVRDLVDQATRRYRRTQEQHGDSEVRTHHLEYNDGGILDMDDPLADLVEDRERLVAVFEVEREREDSPRETMSNGYSSSSPVPESLHYYPHLEYDGTNRGEIEVNEATLKGNTALLVRSSSDSFLPPPHQVRATPPPHSRSVGTPEPEINNVLKGALEQIRVEEQQTRMSPVNRRPLTKTVEFPGNRGPLGIHVVPYCSSLSGRTLGLHIRGIEGSSRSKKENLFQEDECIVQINNTSLLDKTFAQSQEVFRQAMAAPTVRLEVLPRANKPHYEKSLIGQLFTSDSKNSSAKASPIVSRSSEDSKQDSKVEVKRSEMRPKTPEPPLNPSQAAELQPERQTLTPPVSGANPSPTPSNPGLSALDNLTNKKGGKKIKIDLKKGTEGLGFTVVTRDNTVHGPGPILVKNILQRGAAVKDGRLQPGDRILEVNGVDMTGRSQEELVAMLRSTKQGESVRLVVARQEDIFLPRELKGEDAHSLVLEDGREQLMYEIPLNETGSAGLGVSLKGNKSRETGEDLGIFIKSIIHGGAAYKDGRLCVNDQLVAVNGESLQGRSNHASMETLRRSMSSEGNARGTIQLVVLRVPKQIANANQASRTSPLNSNSQPVSTNQESRGYDGPSGHPRPTHLENGSSQTPAMTNNFCTPYPAATTNGSYEDLDDSFPPPPSPGAVKEMNRDRPLTPPHYRGFEKQAFYSAGQQANFKDNVPRSRASKSMDMVADESNVGSLAGPQSDISGGGALGPTLGLWKSSSLESLQTAMSEVRHNQVQSQVPFHRPRLQVVRGRGCNQSFRHAIDKSYEGPSEDDDDMSDHSSGHETQASTSSRNDLDADDGKKKKKTKGKKKEKKTKPKKKSEDSLEERDKKTKKKGFGLLRFGKKKEDKNKDPAKGSKNKLDALSEEELDRIPDIRDGPDPRYAEIHSGRFTPDFEDDDSDPNYARINNFRPPPSPQTLVSRTPSPTVVLKPNAVYTSNEDLEALYAKVNKPKATAAQNNPNQADGGVRREYQTARAIPAYDKLDAARRRAIEYDPNRMAPRAADSRPAHQYEEINRPYLSLPRRDPYDEPRPISNDPASRDHLPLLQNSTQPSQATNQRHYPSSSHTGQQHRAAARQDVPPAPATDQRGRQQYYDTTARRDGYRQASPGRYISPDRYGYGDGGQPDPRRKNPVINAV